MDSKLKEILIESFREALRSCADSTLLAYEDEVVNALRLDFERRPEIWGWVEKVPEETLREIFKGYMEFLMKEVYPKTALARLEREIAEVGEKVEKKAEEIKKEVGEKKEELKTELEDDLDDFSKGVGAAIGRTQAIVMFEAEKTRDQIRDHIDRRLKKGEYDRESRLEIMETVAKTLDYIDEELDRKYGLR